MKIKKLFGVSLVVLLLLGTIAFGWYVYPLFVKAGEVGGRYHYYVFISSNTTDVPFEVQFPVPSDINFTLDFHPNNDVEFYEYGYDLLVDFEGTKDLVNWTIIETPYGRAVRVFAKGNVVLHAMCDSKESYYVPYYSLQLSTQVENSTWIFLNRTSNSSQVKVIGVYRHSGFGSGLFFDDSVYVSYSTVLSGDFKKGEIKRTIDLKREIFRVNEPIVLLDGWHTYPLDSGHYKVSSDY